MHDAEQEVLTQESLFLALTRPTSYCPGPDPKWHSLCVPDWEFNTVTDNLIFRGYTLKSRHRVIYNVNGNWAHLGRLELTRPVVVSRRHTYRVLDAVNSYPGVE